MFAISRLTNYQGCPATVLATSVTPQRLHLLIVPLMIRMIGPHTKANWISKLLSSYSHAIRCRVVTWISGQPHYSNIMMSSHFLHALSKDGALSECNSLYFSFRH